MEKTLDEELDEMAENVRKERLIQECELNRRWREQDGVIYFSVTSDGKTGEEWIKHFESNGFQCLEYTKSVLRSNVFKPTSGVTTKVAVLKGTLFGDSNRITKKIRVEATKRKLLKPNAETACLIREKFSDQEFEDMGTLEIVVMHDSINDSDGRPVLLGVNGIDHRLAGYCTDSDLSYYHGTGFAFAVSQVRPNFLKQNLGG